MLDVRIYPWFSRQTSRCRDETDITFFLKVIPPPPPPAGQLASQWLAR